MEAGLTIDAVLLQPPLKLCSVKIWRLKMVVKIHQFLYNFPTYWQFAWKTNFLNFKNKILIPNFYSLISEIKYILAIKNKHIFMYRIENLVWNSLCQSWLATLLLNWVLITQKPLKGLHDIRLLFLALIILKAISQLFPIWTAKLHKWWYENTSNIQSTIWMEKQLQHLSISLKP